MKKCPRCKSIFTDDTLAFCLSDGAPLDQYVDPDETIEMRLPSETYYEQSAPTIMSRPIPPTIANEVQQATPPKSSGRIWMASTIGLLAVIVGGGAWIFLTQNSESLNISESGKASLPSSPGSSGEMTATQPTPQTAAPTKTETGPETVPAAGTYRVVNVASDDVLYIRPSPGNLTTSNGSIPPGATGVQVTGPGLKFKKSTWFPVSYKGTRGWVGAKFLQKE